MEFVEKNVESNEKDSLREAKDMLKDFLNIFASDMKNFATPEVVARDIAEGVARFDMYSFKNYLEKHPRDPHLMGHDPVSEFKMELAFDLDDQTSEFRFKSAAEPKLVQGIAKVLLKNDAKEISAMVDGLFGKNRTNEIQKLRNLAQENVRQ